jgi:hypothetical protein
MHLLFKARTLFLTGEACKGVRFLMGQSLCTLTHRDMFKKPPMKKEATPKNANELVQKTSGEKRGNHNKSLVPH